MVGFDDPHITGPKKIALRVVVPDDDVGLYVVLGVIAIIILIVGMLLVRLWRYFFPKKSKLPPSFPPTKQP
jgi:hypothetical protein